MKIKMDLETWIEYSSQGLCAGSQNNYSHSFKTNIFQIFKQSTISSIPNIIFDNDKTKYE